MTKLELGGKSFTVGAVKPRRSFPLQAILWPIVVEAAGLLAKLAAKTGDFGPNASPAAPEGSPELPETPPNPNAAKFDRVAKLFEKDVEEILPLITGAFSSVGYDTLAMLQRELLSETFCGGARLFADKPGDIDLFDSALVGRTTDTWRLMWEALKITYPDFLAPLLAFAGRVGAASPSAT